MAVNPFSSHLKAVLYPEAINTDKPSVYQNQCLTVQQFSYECMRNRDSSGEPYGPTVSVLMLCTVRLGQPDAGKMFYQALDAGSSMPYTFLFNASFDQQKLIKDYEDAIIVHGYVVKLEEDYTNQPLDDGTTDQMLLHVTLLLSDITYKGNSSDKVIVIN